MALAACGWGLAKGIITLAGVGFAFHHQRKVQYLEKCAQKLEDESGWGLGRNLQSLAAIGFAFYLQRKVQHLEECVRKLEDKEELRDNHPETRHLEVTSELSPEVSEVSDVVMQLQSEKQELQSSLDNALEMVKEKQCAFEAYRAEVEISMTAVLEKLREKERDCENLTILNERHLQEKEELQRVIERLSNQEEVHNIPLYETKAAIPLSGREEGATDASDSQSESDSESIGRDSSAASPSIKWHDNPLYEAMPPRFTASALPSNEEVTDASESESESESESDCEFSGIGRYLGSASPLIKWHDNPLYEAMPPRFTATALPSNEELTDASESESESDFIGRDPGSASPFIKWHDNPLYEAMPTRSIAVLSGHKDVTNGGRDPGSPLIKWHDNALYESMTARHKTSALSDNEELNNVLESVGKDHTQPITQASVDEENGANFVGRSSSPLSKCRYNPLYEHSLLDIQ